MTSPGTDLSSWAFCVRKDVGNYISIDNTTSFLHQKRSQVQDLKLQVMSPKKNTPKPLGIFFVKRAVGWPHLKGFHVHHVERIVRFISVGEGANCRAKGRCLTANAPFQVTKKKQKESKKNDHLPNPFQPCIFQGQQNLPTFRGEFPVFFSTSMGGTSQG